MFLLFLWFLSIQVPSKPAPAPNEWRKLIGEYGAQPVYILERDGKLVARFGLSEESTLSEVSNGMFTAQGGRHNGERISFRAGKEGRASQIEIAGVLVERNAVEPAPGVGQLRITPLRPIEELRREAIAARPPPESGERLPFDLVELTKLDSGIRLEIRYATTNNFLGSRLYTQARAFLQRPAAEALLRAHRALAGKGFGLLIHDAYRPWFVTKIFWDATPADKKWLVADPAQGSRHNRGAAVDLTLYELKTGKPVEMVSTYDESTPRAHADYPGGASLQRWHRSVLREAMESEGFVQNPQEWWHYDFKDWNRYPIGNQRFEEIPRK